MTSILKSEKQGLNRLGQPTPGQTRPGHFTHVPNFYFSARLPNERVPPINNKKPALTLNQSDFDSFFQQATMAIQAGQSTALRRILQVRYIHTTVYNWLLINSL